MEKTRLGRTNLYVTRTAFGALPIQRTPMDEAVRILRRAYDAGITFFDTARAYSDSEEKLGNALSGVRKNIVIATKSGAPDKQTLLAHIEASLVALKTDYIDIIQLHNPPALPDPQDADSLYNGLQEAKRRGMVRFIGISNHRISVALQAAASGKYDTVQFPLSYISSKKDLAIIRACRKHGVGLIAMKALCGGLIKNIPAAFAFFRQYDDVVPIWGIQAMRELEEFIALDARPPQLDAAMRKDIETDRKELGRNFCHGCGYCMPCPQEIPISMAARMEFMLRRAPYRQFLTDDWKEKMFRIETCTACGQCKSKCPYGLDTPTLLKHMLEDYRKFYKEHKET